MLGNITKAYPQDDAESQIKLMIQQVYANPLCKETWYDLCYTLSPDEFFCIKDALDMANALEYAANKDLEDKMKDSKRR